MGLRAVAVAIVLVVLLPAELRAETKPWAVGVSEANQQKALAKFQEGNASFIKDEWRKALDAYTEALTYWDHPNIRYNAAVCLIKLDRSVEAYEHMQAALRYGDAPLGGDLYKQGETYLQMLKRTTAYIEIVCEQPQGVQVTLDGQPLETCPATKLVLPGKHQIVSEKPGYRTERREVMAPPGGKETVVIVMQLEGTRKLTRRWSRWVPWTVVGVGAALGLASVPLYLTTQSRFDAYDEDVADHCRMMPSGGCEPGEIARFDGQLSDARRLRAITYSSMAIGATGVAVGLVLVLMNQPRLGSTVVTPMTGADRAGVSITAAW